MKKIFLLIAILLALTITNVQAQFVQDVIVTSSNGIWTDSRAYATLNDAVTAVGANKRTIVISSQQTVTSLTIPSTVTLRFERDGSIANSAQLTINTKNIEADNHQIFTGVGNIDFASGTIVKSSWFQNIETAFALTGNDTITLLMTAAHTVTASYSPGNNVLLKWDSPGNVLTVNAGVTVGNLKLIEAGPYQIFGGAGDFDFLSDTILKLSWFNRLRTALAWIETETVYFILDKSETLDQNISIQSNVLLHFQNTQLSGAFTIAFAGSADSQISTLSGRQIFGSTTVVTFAVYGTHHSKWWATGDGATDDTTALQAAITASYGSKLVWDLGTYKVTSTLIATIPNQAEAICFYGVGNNSKIAWYGGNSDVVIQVKGTSGSAFANKSEIKNIFLHNSNAATGMIGLKVGDEGIGTAAGICNLTIEENEIYGFSIGAEIRSESDEVTFAKNRLEGYGTYGLRYYGVGGIRVEKNHFQFGLAGSYAFRGTGNNINLDHNVIQSSVAINGIYFDTVKAFSAKNNYSESTGGTYFLNVVASEVGEIKHNFMGGYPGATLFNVDTNCKNIDFGNNYHGQSGGFIVAQYAIASGAIGITFSGKIFTDGNDQPPDYTNIPFATNQYENYNTQTGNRTVAKIFNSLGGDKYVGAGGSVVPVAGTAYTKLFTCDAPSMYIVNITQGTENYSTTAIVHVPLGSSAAEIFEIGKTNANLTITVSGLDVRATNGVGATRAVSWTATRFY